MNERIAEYTTAINDTLASLIPTHSPFSPSLYEGARYALLAPGKRIRPLLVLAVTEMLQGDPLPEALIPACALEMVHAYSLIHDDLPCMDNDDFRRGQPTLHRVYSEAHAILIGDYLLTRAFEVVLTAQQLDESQKVSLLSILAEAAGGEGMLGGQIMDIEDSSHQDLTNTRKTAFLFQAAVRYGSILGGISPKEATLLSLFGIHFGRLYQAIDDLIDEDNPCTAAEAEESAHVHFETCIQTLEKLTYDTSLLQLLTERVYHHTLQPVMPSSP